MKRITLITGLVFVAMATDARAFILTTDTAYRPVSEAWLSKARAWKDGTPFGRIPSQISIRVEMSQNPDMREWAYPGVIGVYPQTVKSDFIHEIGHQVDYYLLTNDDRGTLQALMRNQGRPWRSPKNSPHEQYAEAFRIASTRKCESDTYGYGLREMTIKRCMKIRSYIIKILRG